jgi:C1A family cysteine protease
LIALVIATSFVSVLSLKCVEEMKTPMHETILSNFKHDTKTLFKVWHFIFNKSYNYNTLEGINKYKTFKANVAVIEAHNKSDSTYKKGLNHLSDMTAEEVKAYYNIKKINVSRLRKGLRNLSKFNLDDYNEDVEVSSSTKRVSELINVDHREKMRPVRDQGNCGSCWAFATHAVLEGFYQIQVGELKDHFSTQQSVDCDTRNGGCNGGWYEGAFSYFQSNSIMYEADYPYQALRGECAYDDTKNSGKKVTGYSSFYSEDGTPESVFIDLLNQGPVAIAVAVDNEWFQYATGIYTGNCPDGVNHAVVAVGYNAGGKCTGSHFIVRNSWGTGWGEEGHIRIGYSVANKNSCYVEYFGFITTGFR